MPRGKQFCPFENDFFESKQFRVVDGTLIHDVDPLHRATDGTVVRKDSEEKVFPVAAMAFAPPSEEETP